jgi:hypothetical protein
VNHPTADGKPFGYHDQVGTVTAVPGDDDGRTVGPRGSYAVRFNGPAPVAPFSDSADGPFPLIVPVD